MEWKKSIINYGILIILSIIAYFVVKYYSEKSTWTNCLKTNTIEEYSNYINKNPDSRYSDIAKEKYDSLLWLNAKNENSSDSYQKYLNYSFYKKDSLFADSYYEEALWKESKIKNTLESFENYNAQSKKKKYINESNYYVEEYSWGKAIKLNTEQLFENYISKYPNGKYIDRAQKLLEETIWETANKSDSILNVNQYIAKYPNGKYKSQAIIRISKLKIIESRKKNLKWLLGQWETLSGKLYIDIKDSINFSYGNSARVYYGTYNVNNNELTLNITDVANNSVVYTRSSVSGSYIHTNVDNAKGSESFDVNYEKMCIYHNGEEFKKIYNN